MGGAAEQWWGSRVLTEELLGKSPRLHLVVLDTDILVILATVGISVCSYVMGEYRICSSQYCTVFLCTARHFTALHCTAIQLQ